MTFQQAEHLVTAFLCISGAAESCVLPFLSLHLTQLGVPPLQTGLSISALLLLRGLSGVLWWRSLGSNRQPGRRRLAVAAGALLSAAVMCALAALPPSTGCGGGPVMGHGPPPLQDGATILGSGRQTDRPVAVASSVSSRPSEGVSGSWRPPAIGGGGGGGTSDPQLPGGGHPGNGGSPPVTGETSRHLRPASSETNQHLRPASSETSREHQPQTGETTDSTVNHRPSTIVANSPHRTQQNETNEQIYRPSVIEPAKPRPVTGTNSPEHSTASGSVGHIPRPPPSQHLPPGTDGSPTAPAREGSGAAAVAAAGSPAGGAISASPGTPPGISPGTLPGTPIGTRPGALPVTSHDTHSGTLPGTQPSASHGTHPGTLPGTPHDAPPDTRPGVPPGAPDEAGSGVSSDDERQSTPSDWSLLPPAGRVPAVRPAGEDHGSRRPAASGWAGGAANGGGGARPPAGIPGPLVHPGGTRTTSSDSKNTPEDSQTASGGVVVDLGDSPRGEVSGHHTADGGDERTPEEVGHHISDSSSAVPQPVQESVASGSQTPAQVGRPASTGVHQTSGALDALLAGPDETEVRRTTRSPTPAGLEDEDGESGIRTESEPSGLESESESETSGAGGDSIDTNGVGHLGDDGSHGFENSSDPFDLTPGHSEIMLSTDSSRDSSEWRGLTGETDQHMPISPSRSDPSQGKQHHHHHHHHHRNHDTDTDRDEGSRRESLRGHEDVSSQGGTHRHPSSDTSNRRPSDGTPSNQHHPAEPQPKHPSSAERHLPSAEEDGARRCLYPSEVEIPWDPRRHPEGLRLCQPTPPTPGQLYHHGAPLQAPLSPPPPGRGLSDPARSRGQPGSPSDGAGHRAAGWRRVPVDSRKDYSLQRPLLGKSPREHSDWLPQPQQATDSDPNSRERNYSLLKSPGDGAHRPSVAALPSPSRRTEHNREGRRRTGGGNRSPSGAVRDPDRGLAEVELVEDTGRGEVDERLMGRSDEKEQSGPSRGVNAALPDAVEPELSVNSRESQHGMVGGPDDDLGSRSSAEARRGHMEPVIHPEAAGADAGSPDMYELSTGRDEAQSRVRRPGAWDSAVLGSRDAPTVDPSGWSLRERTGSGGFQTKETTGSGYNTGKPGQGSEDEIPAHRRAKHHRPRPNSQSPYRPVHPTAYWPSGDYSRNYNLASRTTDGVPTVEPTGGWSLAGALQRLEDLTPRLTRLLSGGKQRRETRRRLRRRERTHRRHRRRQKRSVADVPLERVDFRNGPIEEEPLRDRRWGRNKSAVVSTSGPGDTDSIVAPLSAGRGQSAPLSRYGFRGSVESERPNSVDVGVRPSPAFSMSVRQDVPVVPAAGRGASPLDPYVLFLLTLGLLSVWGSAGAPYRRLVQHCWRRALDEAEHLERSERPRPAAEAASAGLLAAIAGLWPLLPGCLPPGRQPLAVLLVLGAVLSLLAAGFLPWLPLAGGKEPQPRTTAVVRAVVSCRSSLLFAVAVFITGFLTSAEFHFLFPLTATWRRPPQAALLLAAAVALASRLPVRALYRPLMVRCGFVGSVVLSFTALSARCLCYVCVPSVWGLVPAQLLAGLTETLFWRAAHVFVDKTSHDGYQPSALAVLGSLYCAGRCCGVLLAGAAFSIVGGQATFAGLATMASAAALAYYVIARFSGDSPVLAYSKLPCSDRAETAALTGPWSRDPDDPDEVADTPPAADQDWLERAMRQEGLL